MDHSIADLELNGSSIQINTLLKYLWDVQGNLSTDWIFNDIMVMFKKEFLYFRDILKYRCNVMSGICFRMIFAMSGSFLAMS